MKKIYLLILLNLLANYPLFAQPDIIQTNKGEIKITPIYHGAVVFQWDNKTVFVDPYGGANRFTDFPAPDLILISHPHGDHLHKETLRELNLENTELIAPQCVIDELGDIRFKKVNLLKNGEEIEKAGVKIQAVPMYNLPETEDSRHKKGWGNGYVINLGGKNIYISGDTEDIEEMRRLKGIDIAFVCMNLPYTMDIDQAADAILDFKPKIMYPYHFRGGEGKFSDVQKFREIVLQEQPKIDVRLRNWYSEK